LPSYEQRAPFRERSSCPTRPFRRECRKNSYPFGKLLYEARRRKRLGLREFCRLTDTSPTYVSRLETGKAGALPSEARIRRFAELLDVDPLVFLRLAGRVPKEDLAWLAATPDALRLVQVLRRRQVPPKVILEALEGIVAALPAGTIPPATQGRTSAKKG